VVTRASTTWVSLNLQSLLKPNSRNSSFGRFFKIKGWLPRKQEHQIFFQDWTFVCVKPTLFFYNLLSLDTGPWFPQFWGFFSKGESWGQNLVQSHGKGPSLWGQGIGGLSNRRGLKPLPGGAPGAPNIRARLLIWTTPSGDIWPKHNKGAWKNLLAHQAFV